MPSNGWLIQKRYGSTTHFVLCNKKKNCPSFHSLKTSEDPKPLSNDDPMIDEKTKESVLGKPSAGRDRLAPYGIKQENNDFQICDNSGQTIEKQALIRSTK